MRSRISGGGDDIVICTITGASNPDSGSDPENEKSRLRGVGKGSPLTMVWGWRPYSCQVDHGARAEEVHHVGRAAMAGGNSSGWEMGVGVERCCELTRKKEILDKTKDRIPRVMREQN